MSTNRYYIQGDGTIRTVYCYQLGTDMPIKVVVDGHGAGVQRHIFLDDSREMALGHVEALEHWLAQDAERVTDSIAN